MKRLILLITLISFLLSLQGGYAAPLTSTLKIWVEEPIPGDWEMLSKTHSYEKPSAHLIRFEVPVAKDKEEKEKYRIRFRF